MREPTKREIIQARWREIPIGRVPQKRELYRHFRDQLLAGELVRVDRWKKGHVRIAVWERSNSPIKFTIDPDAPKPY